MKFVDLKGRQHSIAIDINKYKRKKQSRSKAQNKLGDMIQEIFPNVTILEEFPCVGTRLHLDYFLPSLKFAFEFDGKQHDEYSDFFHGSRVVYAQSKINDARKEEWCELNKIKLIRVNDKNIEQLEELIYERDEGLDE